MKWGLRGNYSRSGSLSLSLYSFSRGDFRSLSSSSFLESPLDGQSSKTGFTVNKSYEMNSEISEYTSETGVLIHIQNKATQSIGFKSNFMSAIQVLFFTKYIFWYKQNKLFSFFFKTNVMEFNKLKQSFP